MGSERPPSQEAAWQSAIQAARERGMGGDLIPRCFFFEAGWDAALSFVHQRAGEPPTPEKIERVIREAWTAGARDRNADWKEWWLAHRDSVLTVLGHRAGEPPTPDEVERRLTREKAQQDLTEAVEFIAMRSGSKNLATGVRMKLDAFLAAREAERAGEPPTPDDAREWTIGSAIRNGQHRHPTIEGSPWPAVDEPVVVVPKSRLGEAMETCDECGRTGVLEPTNSPEDGMPLCPTCAVAWAISEPPPYSVTERLLGALQRIIEWDEREKPHKNLPLRDCADLARAAISAVRRPGE